MKTRYFIVVHIILSQISPFKKQIEKTAHSKHICAEIQIISIPATDVFKLCGYCS